MAKAALKKVLPGFSGLNPEAEAAAKAQTHKLIVSISEETRANIRNLIARSIRDGIAPRDAAKMIQGMVGLTQRQGQATMNYRETLVKQGLTSKRIEILTQRYADKQLRSRAEMIARTETMRALNDGQKSAWVQAQREGLLGPDARKEWMTVDQACSLCGPMNGRTVLLKDSFGMPDPPAHPRCRCSLGIRPGDVSR